MIQLVMLALLGFFVAGLLALAVAPAFFSRAERLTQERMRARMPVSEAEIRAEKDQLRAKYAVRIHQLQKQAEKTKLEGTRQTIEINRRDARIDEMKSELGSVSTELGTQRNARRVLEQTINERVPQLQSRLNTARNAIVERDSLIQQLKNDGDSQQAALSELEGIVRQQQNEMDQLRQMATNRQDRQRQALRYPGQERDLSLQAEVDKLRARTREQQTTISKLHETFSADGDAAAGTGGQSGRPAQIALATSAGKVSPGDQASHDALEREIADLKVEIDNLRNADATPNGTEEASDGAAELTAQLRALQQDADQAHAELAETTNELIEARRLLVGGTPDADGTSDDPKALRARLSGLKARAQTQESQIKRLRAELTAAERRTAAAAGLRQTALTNAALANSKTSKGERDDRGRGTVVQRTGSGNGSGNGSAAADKKKSAPMLDVDLDEAVPISTAVASGKKRTSISDRLAKQSERTRSSSKNLLSKIKGIDRRHKT